MQRLHATPPLRAGSPVRALWTALRRAWLRQRIRWTEQYLAECAVDGLHHSLSLTEFRRQLDDMRAQLRALEIA